MTYRKLGEPFNVLGGPLGRAARNMGAAALTPADFPTGLIEWQDFSDATTLYTDAGINPVVADGDLIHQANDKSVNTNHQVQGAAGNRGQYKTGIQNGLSVLRLDGIDNWMATGAFAALTQPTLIIMVLNIRDAEGNAAALYDGIGAGNRHYCYTNTGASPDAFSGYAASTWNSAVSAPKNTWMVLSMLWNGASSEIWINGTLEEDSGDVGAMTLTGLTIGSAQAGGGGKLDGDIGELAVYNPPLPEHLDLVGGLMTKWGVS